MLPVETQENIIAEWETFINLLEPVIDSPEENTESFDDEADYAQQCAVSHTGFGSCVVLSTNGETNRKHSTTMNKRLRFTLFFTPVKMRLRNHTMWFLEQCLHKLDIDRYSDEQPIRLRDFLSDYELFSFEEDDNDYQYERP